MELGIFEIWEFLSRGLGIFKNLEIFIPGIRDFLQNGNFLKSGYFYPRGSRILFNLGIIWRSLIPGIFLGMVIFRGWGFFAWNWISHQKANSGIYTKMSP